MLQRTCHVIDGKRYVVGFPVDDAVAIAMEQEGEIMPVPVDDELMGECLSLHLGHFQNPDCATAYRMRDNAAAHLPRDRWEAICGGLPCR